MFEITVNIILKLIPAALSLFILKVYYGIFFEAKSKSIPTFIIWFMFLIWQFCRADQILLPSYVSVFINVVLICMISIIAYSGNVLQKVAFSFLVTAMWMLMEFIVGYLFTLAGWSYYIPLFCGALISEILILTLIFILKRFFENENIRNLSPKYNIAFITIPVGSMYVLYNIFMLSNICSTYGTSILQCLFSTIIVLLINIIVFKVYSSLSKEKEIQRYNTVYEQQLELCTQHMEEKSLLLKEFRNERHDYKQHFSVLNNLLLSGSINEALEYLNDLIDKKTVNGMSICNTDNVVVDALINFKYSIAYSKGIKLVAKVQIPMQLPFSNADLCILLGNILDNAIECVELLPENKKNIDFYMQYSGNVLIIAEKNEYIEKIKRNKKGKILSNKGDDVNHGIGLSSVQKIADKYYGAVVIDTDNQVYKIKVTLCETV